jgi:hypothetical protein
MQVEQTQSMFEVGAIVHHWRTGRTGTVIRVHENGWQFDIKFDEFNAKGREDGLTEKRRKDAFISLKWSWNPSLWLFMLEAADAESAACAAAKPPTYKDILTPDQQLVHEAALQACRERVAAKQARKKAGSERVPEIYKEFVSDDTQWEIVDHGPSFVLP